MLAALSDRNLRRTGTGWQARCPAHDDDRASLSLGEGAGGRLLLKCHAGCETPAVVEALGLRMCDLFDDAAVMASAHRVGGGGGVHRDGFDGGGAHGGGDGGGHRGGGGGAHRHGGDGGGTIAATYGYRDENGELLYEVVRFEPKDFRQRRPDGNGGWFPILGDVRRVLYMLPELLAADPKAPVFICEGEKDVDRLRELGLVATTNAGGAGKWRAEYGEALRGRAVAILPDNDDPGRKHAAAVRLALEGVAASARVLDLPSLPAKGDVSDWLANGGTAAELLALATMPVRDREPGEDDDAPGPSVKSDTATATDQPPGKPPSLGTGPARTPMSTIAARAVAWLWRGRLPAGAVVTMEGMPAAGKSTLATEIVACVTSGRALYGAAPTAPRSALWIGHEEGLATALRPRLDAAGADPSRVFVYRDPPSFPADYAWLAREIRDTDSAIVIVDPIDAYLDFGTRGDSHRNGDVRVRLRDLSVVAEETGATIVMVRHWRKAGGIHAIYRSAGSLAYSAIARAMITVGEDPTDPARRTAAWPKMSDAPAPPSIAWAIGEDRRVQWIGEDPRSASELMAAMDAQAAGHGGGASKSPAADAAETWLMRLFEEADTIPSEDVSTRAILDGIALPTLERARRKLGIRSRRENVPGGRGKGRWVWRVTGNGSVGGGDGKRPKGIKQPLLIPLTGNDPATATNSALDMDLGNASKEIKAKTINGASIALNDNENDCAPDALPTAKVAT